MSGVAPVAPATAPAFTPLAERAKLAAAAQKFEAIFVRQMLASARQAGGEDSLFGSQAADTFKAMQDNRFAEIASQSGALGLAKTIEQQLARHVAGPNAGQAESGN